LSPVGEQAALARLGHAADEADGAHVPVAVVAEDLVEAVHDLQV
jgi:hypothetical protein